MAETKNKAPYVSVTFDLSGNSGRKRTEGRADFYPDRIEIWGAEGMRTVKTDNIKSYKCGMGVGCALLEAESLEGGEILICRGSMEKNDTFANAVKILNRCLENGTFENSENIEEGVLCPKCHRPFPHGSKKCPHCEKKGSMYLTASANLPYVPLDFSYASLGSMPFLMKSVILPRETNS